MRILEIFNNPIEPSPQFTDDKMRIVNFEVGGIKYELMASTLHSGIWALTFDAEISPGDRVDHVTGTGNEVKVFSTVYNWTNVFLSDNVANVKELTFTSDVPSRTKLYSRLANMWAKQHNLTVATRTNEWDEHEFVLTNPEYKKGLN